MSERANRFLGGSPLSVLIRLILLSIAVGVILAWLDITPQEILDRVIGFFDWLMATVFGSVDRVVSYFLLGAVIVVPIFIISRLFRWGRN